MTRKNRCDKELVDARAEVPKAARRLANKPYYTHKKDGITLEDWWKYMSLNPLQLAHRAAQFQVNR